MTARRYRRHALHALSALLCGALALPVATAVAATPPVSGGSGLGGGTGTAPTPVSGGAPIATAGGGVTLDTTSTTLVGQALTFSGTAAGAAGQTVEIQREGASTNGQWVSTASVIADSTGAFTATWTSRQAGQFSVRAIVVSSLASAAAATPPVTVTVYQGAKATLYGPGFYGRQTACGMRLTRSTIGVANRTLPCGTQVSILYDGETLTVPVIDRGPYANGADWDLTEATGAALGMTGTEYIGAVSLPTAGASARRARS